MADPLVVVRTGPSFTTLTVTVKVSLPEFPAVSVAVIVTVELPEVLLAGVTTTVRLLSLPPVTMFAVGTNVVLLESVVIVKSEAVVVESFTVNTNDSVGTSSLTV